MAKTIPASLALDMITAKTHSLIDVRSEAEFVDCSIPGFENEPILQNDERHMVGLCFRQKGQDAAIALGHKLVAPHREARIERWLKMGQEKANQAIILSCWRGGLRSSIACEWLLDAGRDVVQVEGGYKAMRQELMGILANPPKLLVLSGMTGSGKTKLISSLKAFETLDIEDLAAHRGSSFGRLRHRSQPRQASFENALAMGLRHSIHEVLLEDESKAIGRVHLPEALTQKILTSPIILMDVAIEQRVENIFQEYIVQPLAEGAPGQELADQILLSIQNLEKRLGGALTTTLISQVKNAFAGHSPHSTWIENLLVEYYDRSYRHSFNRMNRPVLFRGSFDACHQWLLARQASNPSFK